MFLLCNVISFGMGAVVTYEVMKHKLKNVEKALDLAKKADKLMSNLSTDLDKAIEAMLKVK